MGRIIGLEHEYGIMLPLPNGDFRVPHKYEIRAVINKYVLRNGGLCGRDERIWLANGGGVYEDSGHPEDATPECSSPEEAVLYSRAGDILMQEIFPNFLFHKNNLSSEYAVNPATFGCHENYWTRFKKYDDEEQKNRCYELLTPFLASRQIIDGAGWVDKSGEKFMISQRAGVLHYGQAGYRILVSGTTMERPVFKSDDWITDGRYCRARLHFSAGDANILDFALFLKISVTDLVLAMFEDGFMPDWICHDPQEAFGLISRDLTYKEKVMVLDGGKAVSALEAQRFYCNSARKYLESEVRKNSLKYRKFKNTIRLWSRTLQALSKDDIGWLVGRVDHRTKRFLIECDIKKSSDPIHRRKVDLQYHKINRYGLGAKVRRFYSKTQMVSEEEAERAARVYPSGSRARIRGKIISGVLKNKEFACLRDFIGWNIDWWSVACVLGHDSISGPKAETRWLYDPLETRVALANNFLKRFKVFLKKIYGRLA